VYSIKNCSFSVRKSEGKTANQSVYKKRKDDPLYFFVCRHFLRLEQRVEDPQRTDQATGIASLTLPPRLCPFHPPSELRASEFGLTLHCCPETRKLPMNNRYLWGAGDAMGVDTNFVTDRCVAIGLHYDGYAGVR
jgi:hypothetical protein